MEGRRKTQRRQGKGERQINQEGEQSLRRSLRTGVNKWEVNEGELPTVWEIHSTDSRLESDIDGIIYIYIYMVFVGCWCGIRGHYTFLYTLPPFNLEIRQSNRTNSIVYLAFSLKHLETLKGVIIYI
ncbi:unnamed protein product [Choristocarpus tenellus]